MSDFLDLSGAEVRDFEPLPSGEYDATLIEIELTESSTLKPMVKVVFGISEEGYEGRKLYSQYVLRGNDDAKTKVVLGMFVGFLAACTGKDAEEIKAEGFDPSNLSDLIGSEIVLRVGPPDEGFDFNKVKGVKPAGTKVSPKATSGLL
jgi:hypothetical protein